jgi:glycerol-3-phosphate dehydrogenase
VIGAGNYGTGVAEYATSDGHVVSVTYGFDDAS